MDELKLVDQYLEKLDWEVRENSNMTYSLQGAQLLHNLKGKLVEEVYPEEVAQAHLRGTSTYTTFRF